MNPVALSEYSQIHNALSPSVDTLRNKSILITGATGLIGSYLVNFLNYLNTLHDFNINIYATSTGAHKLSARFAGYKNTHFIVHDFTTPFSSDIAFDYIIHAASPADPQSFVSHPVETMLTNIIGTQSLLEHIRQYGGHMLYLSSGEIYGNTQDSAATENDFGSIDTKTSRACYPESKRASEALCASYIAQYDLHVNIARLCYIYGASITDTSNRADADFLRHAINHTDIVLNSPCTQRRTYCYIADAVSGILHILLHSQSGDVFNIANPESITTLYNYAKILADLAGIKVIAPAPDNRIVSNSVLDASKLIQSGWTPHYNLQDGLSNTLKQSLK